MVPRDWFGLFLVLFMFILCARAQLGIDFENLGVACPHLSGCNKRGTCMADSDECACFAGFRGVRCSVGPTELIQAEVVPAYVRIEQDVYFQLDSALVNIDDEIVIRLGSDGDVDVYAVVGRPPLPDKDIADPNIMMAPLEANGANEKVITILSVAPAQDSFPDDTNLYITVRGAVGDDTGGVEFEVFHRRPSALPIVGGLDNWAAFVMFGVLFCLLCLVLVFGVFMAIAKCRKGRDTALDAYGGGDGGASTTTYDPSSVAMNNMSDYGGSVNSNSASQSYYNGNSSGNATDWNASGQFHTDQSAYYGTGDGGGGGSLAYGGGGGGYGGSVQGYNAQW